MIHTRLLDYPPTDLDEAAAVVEQLRADPGSKVGEEGAEDEGGQAHHAKHEPILRRYSVQVHIR